MKDQLRHTIEYLGEGRDIMGTLLEQMHLLWVTFKGAINSDSSSNGTTTKLRFPRDTFASVYVLSTHCLLLQYLASWQRRHYSLEHTSNTWGTSNDTSTASPIKNRLHK